MPEPGDEQIGDYSHERLIQMDGRFCKRLELAFALGCEHRASAASPSPPSARRPI